MSGAVWVRNEAAGPDEPGRVVWQQWGVIAETDSTWTVKRAGRQRTLQKADLGLTHLIHDSEAEGTIWLHDLRLRLKGAEQVGDTETATYLRYLLRPHARQTTPEGEEL